VTETERHRERGETEWWGTEGHSQAGRGPERQRLKETPRDKEKGRKERESSTGDMEAETHRGRKMSRDTQKHTDTQGQTGGQGEQMGT
jgi:hypothetical protein